MSSTYSDLVHTQFPDSSDTYEYMSDLTADLVSLASQYETYINNKKFNEAAQLLKDNPLLNKIYFNAEKYNKLIDSIKAIQRLYKDDIQSYILELVKYIGTYSSSTKYTKYNVVNYNSQVYMCTSPNTPLGTVPTNTSYWYPLSIKGDRGEAGLGLSFCGYWSSTATYSRDSAVTYNNSLYASLVDNNLSHTPASNSSYWSEIVNFNTVTAYNNASSGTTATTMQGAIDELYSKANTNISSINTINTKLNTIENGAQKNTVIGIKGDSESSYRTGNINITKANIGLGNCDNTADSAKSVKYATNAGNATTSSTCTGNSATATYANSAGNCDTIDGYHITVSTTDLTTGTSPLTTNTLCFVYE